MIRRSRPLAMATAVALLLTGLIARPAAADGTLTMWTGFGVEFGVPDGQSGELTVTDADGTVEEISCDQGALVAGSVQGLGTSEASAALLVPYNQVVECTAKDNSGNTVSELLGPFSFNATPALIVVLGFPEPEASGWFTQGPVEGYIGAFIPNPGGVSANVTDLTCTGAEWVSLSDIGNGFQGTLAVSEDGVHDVSCTATDSEGRKATQVATVRLDVGNDRDLEPADGVSDSIGAGSPWSWDDDNDPTPGTGTFGRIVSGAGVLVQDAPNLLEGVQITTTTEVAVLEMCNPLRTVTQAANTVTTETCGSVTARVDVGTGIKIYLGPDTYVAVPQGITVKVDQALNGSDTIQVQSQSGFVTLVNGDASRKIGVADGVITAQTWTFTGFSQPVDNGGVMNTIKGGQTVPLKWRLTQNGAPVTTLTYAKVTFPKGCAAAGAEDDIEQTTSDVSGLLKNLGSGYYQYNWKTPRTPGACGNMLLDIGDGVQHSAAFRMK